MSASMADDLLAVKFTEGRRLARDKWSRDYLRALLKETKGNISHAAKKAGMHRANLQRAIRQLLGEDEVA